MSEPPVVSVIMANHNGGEYLKAAVESVLQQSFADFEFIIVDDCSTQGDVDYLYSLGDSRLRILCNERNRGQTVSLNRALSEAGGHYIARMDSDDVCFPDRLEQQVAAMEAAPDLQILGTQAVLIDADDREIGKTNLPTEPDSVWAYSILQSPFIHPAVMMRGAFIREGGFEYDPAFINQDFELWSRILPHCAGSNLKRPLIRYRVHENSMTTRHYEENLKTTADIIEVRLAVENLSGIIKRREMENLLRYLFADRRQADAEGVDRVALGRVLWRFYQNVRRRRPHRLRQYTDLMVYRIFQSALWPHGLRDLPGRLALLAKMVFTAPVAVGKMLMWTVPMVLLRRIC